MARYLAKNIVASGKADNCTVQLSYAIGVKEPTSVYVYADGVVRSDLTYELQQLVDLTPKGIIDKFNLFDITLSGHNKLRAFWWYIMLWEQVDLF